MQRSLVRFPKRVAASRRASASVAALLATTALLLPPAAFAQQPPCAALQKHLNRSTSLRTFMITESAPRDGKRTIPKVDIDGDGEPEQITVTRPQPSDRFPPESSAISIVLSRSQIELRTEYHRLYLIRFQTRVWLVGSRLLDPQGPVLTDVQRVTKDGFIPACSYECNLRGGCRPRGGQDGK